jgi:hypothetical protein
MVVASIILIPTMKIYFYMDCSRVSKSFTFKRSNC